MWQLVGDGCHTLVVITEQTHVVRNLQLRSTILHAASWFLKSKSLTTEDTKLHEGSSKQIINANPNFLSGIFFVQTGERQ